MYCIAHLNGRQPLQQGPDVLVPGLPEAGHQTALTAEYDSLQAAYLTSLCHRFHLHIRLGGYFGIQTASWVN